MASSPESDFNVISKRLLQQYYDSNLRSDEDYKRFVATFKEILKDHGAQDDGTRMGLTFLANDYAQNMWANKPNERVMSALRTQLKDLQERQAAALRDSIKIGREETDLQTQANDEKKRSIANKGRFLGLFKRKNKADEEELAAEEQRIASEEKRAKEDAAQASAGPVTGAETAPGADAEGDESALIRSLPPKERASISNDRERMWKELEEGQDRKRLEDERRRAELDKDVDARLRSAGLSMPKAKPSGRPTIPSNDTEGSRSAQNAEETAAKAQERILEEEETTAKEKEKAARTEEKTAETAANGEKAAEAVAKKAAPSALARKAISVAGSAARSGLGMAANAAAAYRDRHDRYRDYKDMQGGKRVSGWSGFLLLLTFAAIFYGLAYGNYLALVGAAAVLFLFSIFSNRFRDEFFTIYMVITIGLLVIHAFIFSMNFVISTMTIALFVGPMVALFIVRLIFSNSDDENLALFKSRMLAIIIGIVVYLIPWAVKTFIPVPDSINVIIIGLVAIIPINVIMWLNSIEKSFPDGYVSALMRSYRLIVGFIVFGLLVYGIYTAASGMPQVSVGGVDAKAGLAGFWTTLSDKFSGVYAKGFSLWQEVENPQAYYDGQVEQNAQKPLGVDITDLQSIDPIVSNNSNIVVTGIISARSFVSNTVTITPSCTIERSGVNSEAVVDPTSLDVVYGTGQSFQCTFDPQKSGTYTVKASGTFTFETWAYIPFTFVDEERAINLAKQGKAVRDALSIAEKPTAVFTSGPISVGMGGSSQPILVSTSDTPILQAGANIGLTVDNAWSTSGKIKRVDSVILKVPQPFALSDCTRNQSRDPQVDDKDSSYTNYYFDNPTFDALVTWSSVNCHLTIPEDKRDEALKLVSEGDKTVRSFIAVVDYDYTVQKTTSVKVQ